MFQIKFIFHFNEIYSLKTLFQDLSGGKECNRDKHKSGFSITRLRFESANSRIKKCDFNHYTAMFKQY
jgi:hypothetical protein